jgi:hypothetical protein
MTQPTQDPWGNDKQQPIQPQQPSQPYSFPQPGYVQPTQPQQGVNPQSIYPQGQQIPSGYYQQQQPQFNPGGVYGGVPNPRAVKQWPWWATLLLVFGVVIIIGVLANANKSTTTSNQQQVVATAAPFSNQGAAQAAPTDTTLKLGKVGETIALKGYTLTVNSVQKSENFDTSNVIGKAKAGNILLAVDITIVSNKAKGVSANGLYASVKDSQGFKYDFTIFGQKEPRIAGTNDIPAGDKVRGWVTFEIPKTASGLILEYAQLFESEKIRVALG